MGVPERLSAALAGRYVVERELGAGGMATVYQARDLRHDRAVALKVLRPDLAESLGRERFLREIHLAARLNHPHILPLHDSGEADGFLYFVMPVVEGESLRDRLERERPLPVDVAIRLAAEVADALDYAHRHDVVHRDIKPENILLHAGHAVVADFGIGKAVVAARRDTGTLTQVGATVGTPAYMSPEQAAGDDVDGRSDLFSLGCVMYEMLTGEPPFSGPTLQSLIASRFHHTPPAVTTRRPAVPGAVSRTVAALLERSPGDRPASGAVVVAALRSSDTLTPVPERIEQSVAVLPFVNLSADPDNEFFSDGITEDIIGALTRVPALRVTARASAFSFKGKNEDLAAIGRRLGVRHVLQGSVRRAGNRVRVTAQLMEAASDAQLWSERYDRDLDDIFAIQDEIAHGIAQHLEATLASGAAAPLAARATGDVEAYELFLRGREAMFTRTPTSMALGTELLQQAIVRDPRFVRARLALVEGYAAMGVYAYRLPAEARRAAEAVLRDAERLAPEEPLLPTARAYLAMYLSPHWPAAKADLDRALALEPRGVGANLLLAQWHARLGHRDERSEAARAALAADPLSPYVHSTTAHCYFATGEYERALALHERALALDANYLGALWGSGLNLCHLGETAAGLHRIQRAVEMSGAWRTIEAFLVWALGFAGRTAEARAIADHLPRDGSTPPFAPLIAEIRLGDEERLAGALRQAIAGETGPMSLSTTIMPELDALLDHPRLGSLVRQLALYAEHPGRART